MHYGHYHNDYLDSFAINNSNPFQLIINQPLPPGALQQQHSPVDPTFFNLNDGPEEKANLSRHVSSVISHFTASKEGYSRLLNELDDFIHSISTTNELTYVSPSCLKHLGYTQDELSSLPINEIVHKSDWTFFQTFLQNSLDNQTEFLTYCRYLTKSGSIKMFEIRGKPYIDNDPNAELPCQVILSARDYSTKSTQALDSVIELQIERLGLRTKLEHALRRLGRDPSKNVFLTDQPDGEEFADTFLQMPRPELPDYSLADLFPPSPATTMSTKPAEPEKKKVFLIDDSVNEKSPMWICSVYSVELQNLLNGEQVQRVPKRNQSSCRLCNACGLAYYKKNKKMAAEAKKAK